jgi:HAD superfamily hydrolase (TIGR01509 family)
MTHPTIEALVFDVDGTLADTEEVHRQAFNQAFAEDGLDWHWDVATYTRLLDISGGKERLHAYWQETHPEVTDLEGALQDRIQRLHDLKTASYEAAVHDGAVTLRPGVLALMDEALKRNLKLAIATTTSPVNIAALMRRAVGEDWGARFAVIEDASTARKKKPDPMVYEQTLQRLGVPASGCVAFEDSSNGLQAARAAGMAHVIITPTAFTAHQDFSHALQVLPSLAGVTVDGLNRWVMQGQSR